MYKKLVTTGILSETNKTKQLLGTAKISTLRTIYRKTKLDPICHEDVNNAT